MSLTEELNQMRQADQDLSKILDAYQEIEGVFIGALEAMGVSPRIATEVTNSANVSLSFNPSSLSSNQES